MTVFILSFIVLLGIVIAMSVGVLMGGKPIKGSCGGMSALGMDTACDVCGGDTKKCEKEQQRQQGIDHNEQPLAYNVGKSGAAKDDIKK